jgi:hypothetical protein
MKCNFCDRIIWPWQSRLHTVTFNPFHLTCGIAYELGFDKGYEVARNRFSLESINVVGFSSPSGLGRIDSIKKM